MSVRTPVIILASSSPRRRELLSQMGIAFEVQVANLPEVPRPGESALEYVPRLALEKAQAVRERLGTSSDRPVLGADTEVVLDGEILGKPQSRDAGLAMLERLSGRSHQVISAVAITDGNRTAIRVSQSRVTFRPTTADERERYWQSGEPTDKAGGYAVQGLGAVFIERIDGSYSGIMGLPIFETAALLMDFGIRVV